MDNHSMKVAGIDTGKLELEVCLLIRPAGHLLPFRCAKREKATTVKAFSRGNAMGEGGRQAG